MPVTVSTGELLLIGNDVAETVAVFAVNVITQVPPGLMLEQLVAVTFPYNAVPSKFADTSLAVNVPLLVIVMLAVLLVFG